MTSFADSHCHLYDTRGADLDDVLQAARQAGVGLMVNVGCDAATSAAALDIADAHPDVVATVGLHPHEARHGIDTILGLFDRPGVVAVGECGLDYYYDHSPRDAQREVFAAQIQLAHERQLPLVVHTRDAWEDTFDVLRAEGVPATTIFHCFTGGSAEARTCLDLGGMLSFSGIVTFANAHGVHEAAVLCPPDRLLAETDSPYLAPVPHRGRTNQAAYVVHVVERLATLRGETTESVAAITWENARLAFLPIRP